MASRPLTIPTKLAQYADMMSSKSRIYGRCLAITSSSITIANQSGVHNINFTQNLENIRAGDLVTIEAGILNLVAANTTESRSLYFQSRIQDPRRQRAMKVRALVELKIKEFFLLQDFLEVRTPLLVRSPGMETHIRPFELSTGEFLPTSPEFAMKKLLVGGLEKIFQITPAFRLEEKTPHHHPEFMLLEWYRAYAGYEVLMHDFESLVESLANHFYGDSRIPFGPETIEVKTPWPRLKIRDLFAGIGIDLVQADTAIKLAIAAERLGLHTSENDSWDDIYFRIWLTCIEPKLPRDRALFVCRYPASQAALSVVDVDADGSKWAKRFEPYAGGLELGNAFEELTDPKVQRARFISDMNLREKIYGDNFAKSPIDEEFIQALEEGMPPASGIAVGVDRLVMLLANEPDIDHTMWLPSYTHK